MSATAAAAAAAARTARASSATTSAPRPSRARAASLLSPSRGASHEENERTSPAREPASSPKPQKCHVLLVEDDVPSANALRVILTMHGCEVVIARTLEQGLDLLRTNPTVIILDMMLPDGDGIEILIRVREANLPIKVAVTTAICDPSRLTAIRRYKPDGILSKPLDLGELLRAIGLA
jgi:CheY-like chemotaxis protein